MRWCPSRRTRYADGRSALVRSGGHTLIEILLVVVILMAMAGLALPRFDYVGMRLDAMSRQVRGVLQQAWRLSVQKQHDVLVSMDTVAGQLRIIEDTNNDGIVDASERVTVRTLEEGVVFSMPSTGIAGPVGAAVTGPGVKVVGSLPTIVFHRNGSTSGDVQLYLAAADRGVWKRRAITVAHATGRTEWFRWANGTWRMGGI